MPPLHAGKKGLSVESHRYEELNAPHEPRTFWSESHPTWYRGVQICQGTALSGRPA